MINAQLSQAFEQIGELMEIQGENTFRVNSYYKVARTIGDLTEDIAVIAAEGRLADLPGIGKASSEKIQEFLATGKIAVLEELRAAVPPELPKLLKIPGLGPKKAALIWKELGVTTLDELKAALDSGQVATLKGLGEKSAKKIAEGLAFVESVSERTPLGVARPIAEEIAECVKALPGVRRVEIAGSLRRGKETIGDIDLLCDADNGAEVVAKFTTLPMATRVLAAGDTKGAIIVGAPGQGAVQVDLRVVPAESFGAALQYFTGNKEHNIRLREMASKRKLLLNEWGLFSGEKSIAGATEEEIYARLDLAWPPPETREDKGELQRPDLAETLIRLEHIRGDLHMHTTASDGRATAVEMAAAARKLGYEYIAICDHSPSSVIANGLSIERMQEQIEMVRKIGKHVPGITVLVGTECDILPDGALDYPDEILAECDLVVASVHSAMGQERGKITQRVIRAVENKWVTILGHPTGRLINRRAPMDIDMAEVIAAAKATGTALEVNCSWQRLDLKDLHIRQALDAGVTLSVNTDSHATNQLEQMRYGVTTLRRGWATPGEVINTFTLAELRKWIAGKRGG